MVIHGVACFSRFPRDLGKELVSEFELLLVTLIELINPALVR